MQPRRRGGWLCFFQAEDGIRDWSVTGVQTCALPICLRHDYGLWDRDDLCCWRRRLLDRGNRRRRRVRRWRACRLVSRLLERHIRGVGTRSEERRVGKEGRSRWWADE